MTGATSADLVSGHDADLYHQMRDLNEKLLTLNYQREFVSGYRCPPITRYFFCRQINQAQQFYTFCCLSSYLINKLGSESIRVDGFDDPNLTIDKILKASHQYLDTSGFDKQKLKQGFGPEVIRLLNGLTEKLLAKVFPQDQEESKVKVVIRSSDGSKVDQNEDDDDDDDLDNENEIELEEEFEDYLEAESDLAVQDEWQDDSLDAQQQNDQQRQMIVANTDLTEWKMELERVLPQMNARFVAGQNQSLYQNQEKIYDSEWRIHFKAARQHHSAIESIFKQTDGMLRSITDDLGAMLEKIRSKETYLHQNASTILAEWINVRERALAMRSMVDRAEAELEARTQQLQDLAEEDRQTKQLIEEYSLKITDSAPLAEAKKARENLKQELTRVNLQIGVAVQTLVRHVTLHSSYVH